MMIEKVSLKDDKTAKSSRNTRSFDKIHKSEAKISNKKFSIISKLNENINKIN